MNANIRYYLDSLFERYPLLISCEKDIIEAYNVLCETFNNKSKLLMAGNGGSCSDCEHIAGELMKSFKKSRTISHELAFELKKHNYKMGTELEKVLQEGLPCIALNNHQSLNTAFINDVENGALYSFAQQINVYGNEGDAFLAISTSGNSKNIYYASLVAKAKRIKIIALTGKTGGILGEIADVSIRIPSIETYIIQEFHLPVYHCLCLMLEETFF